MPGAPAVSVVITSYNVADYIGPAIESALSQTFADFELIIADDGSTDATRDVVSRFSDPRIRAAMLSHRGASAALCVGLSMATAPYIAFLDGDDLWHPDKLARHVEILDQHPEVDLTFSWSRIVDQSGSDTGLTTRLWKGPLSFSELLVDNVIGNGSAPVFRQSALEAAGGIDTTLTGCYDLDAWLRIALLRPGNVCAIPQFLTYYRRRSGQLTTNVPMMERAFSMLLEKMQGLAPSIVAPLEEKARSNMQRFFAFGWYQAGDYRKAVRYMARSFRGAPTMFLSDRRNWEMSAAATAGLLLPAAVHGYLTRAALKAKAKS